MAQGQESGVGEAPDTLPPDFFDKKNAAPDTLPADFFEKKNAAPAISPSTPGAYQTRKGGPIQKAPREAPSPSTMGEFGRGLLDPIKSLPQFSEAHNETSMLGSYPERQIEDAADYRARAKDALKKGSPLGFMGHALNAALALTTIPQTLEAMTHQNPARTIGQGVTMGAMAKAPEIGSEVVERAPAITDLGVKGLKAVKESLGNAVEGTKSAIGRATRIEPTVENTAPNTGTIGKPTTVSSLRPWVKAVTAPAKLVGGPDVANAILPRHPTEIGPFRRLATGPRTAAEVGDLAPEGTGAPLPAASDFYEQKGAAIMARAKEQAALDRQAARTAAEAKKTEIVPPSRGISVGEPSSTGSEGTAARWTNETVRELAAKGNRTAIEQSIRRGLPLPANSRYVMGDPDYPRAVLNPRETTIFSPEGTAIGDKFNARAENPSSRARIEQVPGKPPETSQPQLRFGGGMPPARPPEPPASPIPAEQISPPNIPAGGMAAAREAMNGPDMMEVHAREDRVADLQKRMQSANETERRNAQKIYDTVYSGPERRAAGPPASFNQQAFKAAKSNIQNMTWDEQAHKWVPKEATAREPKEQIAPEIAKDTETMEQAKNEIAAMHDLWSTFDKPGIHFSKGEVTRSGNPVSEFTHATESARAMIEQQFPWLKDLPKMTAGKLKAAVESGKGVEYNRLVNEAGKHIQATKAASAPVIEEFRSQLETAAEAVKDSDPDLAATFRGILDGKYSSYSDLAGYVKEKLHEAETADEFNEALSRGFEETPESSTPSREATEIPKKLSDAAIKMAKKP